jgi:GT2 family glycosyltransferase
LPHVPKVSVVIPTYNRPIDLGRAIRTVKLQSLTDWEVLIVDDGSPAAVVLNGSDAADGRIHLVRHPESRGVSQARNTGLAHARAPWIAFLDDDDLWWPGKLELQLMQAETHGASFVFTGRYTIDRGGEIVSLRGPAPVENLTRTLLFRNLVGEPSSVIVRRELFAETGGFDTRLSVIADWDMWVRLSRVAVPLGLPEMTTAIVFHEDSMQLTKALSIPLEVDAMRHRHADLLAAEQMALGSMLTELWMGNKRWRSQRSPRSLVAYIRVARRHRQTSAIARRLVRRKLAELVAGPPDLAPDWVLEQLGILNAAVPEPGAAKPAPPVTGGGAGAAQARAIRRLVVTSVPRRHR